MAAPSSFQRIMAYLQGGATGVEQLLSGPKSGMQGLADTAVNNEKEIREVAKVLAAEAANQGVSGMVAVANTIGNRAKSRNKTPFEVVSEKNQYFGYTNENKEKIFAEVENEALDVARRLYEGKLKDTTSGAEYFLLPKEKIQKWHGDRTVRIGDHTFYKEKK